MKMNKSWTAGILAVFAILAAGSTARAQWISRPSDLDPFNRNSSVSRSARDLDQQRISAVEGTPYTFTLRNPNVNGIHFTINRKPYLVMGHQRITIKGRGTPEIRFPYGAGSDSFRSYTLRSGRTYVFRWQPASLGAPYDGVRSLLNLYAE